MLTGGLIGLLGGPVGAAVGLGAGTLIGAAFDLTKEGVDRDFVEDAGARLEPGKAAVIAEIDEQWQMPLDTRMEGLGGQARAADADEIEDAYLGAGDRRRPAEGVGRPGGRNGGGGEGRAD